MYEMKPISLLQSLLLVHAALAAPASPNIRPRRSSIGIPRADTDLDNSSSHTSSYQTQSVVLTGSRQLSITSSQRALSTRQLKLLRDLNLNHISDKELRKIILWLNEKWPAADGLIQSIQELIDIGYPDQSSSLSPEPYSTIHDKPLPTTSLTYQAHRFGDSASPTSSSQVTLTSAGFTKESLTHFPISAVSDIKPPIISNIPALAISSIASSSSLPTLYLATSPQATMTATANNHDTNLFTVLKMMDTIDELIIWVSERPAWVATFIVCALVLLFLISIVIVEGADFAYAFVSTRLASWGWRRRRPAIHLSGPERRLITAPTADSDGEKREEMNYGTCD
ncbi:uncharacterized protein BDCG_06219 [Blastomyces dermatitidis ER-3]|uniref:Ankyrin repeat protein n=1 Tax=Ajellomyces dermatitidis (strain ER-3 / ATCC MYA-2586) TaxID=559297 RepID=A0ABP2F2P6_AJEDR|nr:uncharacterized protein BDCG_06219 [Blastomyces dermatitidis ER-3]EEQ91099.1 hypothetical protein BDCG_06219 [Blastomyces dermatitidis ER-3]